MPSLLLLLDAKADPAPSPAWADEIDIGTVVAYRFPAAEPDLTVPPKVRPCLVVERHDGDGYPRVVLAFGTTSPQRPRGAYDVIVPSRVHAPSAGLDHPTLFQLDRLLSVSVASAAFSISARTASPILGRLEGRELQCLQAVRGRLHAEADIAAERRAEARRARDRRRISEPRTRTTSLAPEPRWRAIPEQARPVVVEHRRRRPAGPGLRLVSSASEQASSAPTPADQDSTPVAGSARPTLTIRRPTPPESTTSQETSR